MEPNRTDGPHSYYDGEQRRAIVTTIAGKALAGLSAVDYYERRENGWHRVSQGRELDRTARRMASEWAKGS